jgi:ubiquinone/menaquinone biosynthesis C-methylase UbiE
VSKPAVSIEFQELYEDYYDGTRDSMKRMIAAKDTLEHIKLVSNGSLGRTVDVGAGDGALLALLSRSTLASELHGLEISASGIDKIQERSLPLLKSIRQFDGYAIPYPDQSFDTALCIHVLEHVEHERLFLRELARISKSIILEVPLEHGIQVAKSIRVSGPFGHINFYTPETLLALLRSAGLEPISHRVLTSSREYEQFLYGRLNGALRNGLRRMALNLSPKLSTELMTYLFTVRCEPIAEKSGQS